MKKRLLGLFLLWSLILLIIASSIQALSLNFEPETQVTETLLYVPGELLVRLTSVQAAKGASLQASSAAWSRLGVVEAKPLIDLSLSGSGDSTFATNEASVLERTYRLKLKANADIMSVAAALREDPTVELAELNYFVQTAVTPDDAYYFQQWGLTQIGAEAAWDITQGSTSMTIAILDTGMDLDHPDLTGRLWVNPGEVPSDGIDNDNNGYVDDVSGWNFVEDNAWLQDDSGHGTHVTGIAAANGNNSIGVAGVDWNTRIMPLRILNAGGAGTHADAAAALYYAAEKGAQVINMSFGAYADSQTLRDAVEYASQTALLVGAAGNNNQTDLFYPAAYPQVLAVAGTGPGDVKGSFSNYGDWVDISAPGQTIWSTVYDDSYVGWSGTSMSAPFVAGAATLVWSNYPNLSVGGLRRHLMNVATDVDTPNPAYIGLLGSGRLDLLSALTTQPQPQLVVHEYTVDGVLSGNPEPNTTVAITITLSNTWADAVNVTGILTTTSPYITLTNDNATFGNILGDASQSNPIPFTFNLDPTTPFNHPITFTLDVLATDGYSATLPFTVTTASSIQNIGALTINTDTIWTADRQYIIGGQVQVVTGITLTIQPGVLMQFQPAGSIVINGKLVANGTANTPIVFKGTDSGQWGGLTFTNSNHDAILDATDNYLSGSILQHAHVLSATTGVTLQSASPFIANSVFSGNGTGIAAFGDKSLIQNNTFTNNTTGLSLANGSLARIKTNKFESNTTGLAGTDVTINVHENHFVENDTGLSLTTAGTTVIDNNLIEKNNVGVDISPGWPTSDRTHPDIAYMATPDEYLVVWQDHRDPNEAHIYGQRLSSDGTLLEGEIPISVSGDSLSPQLACDPVGNTCLIMYRPQEVQSGGYEITGQMITPDGSLSGLPFSIGTYTGTLSSFALVSNPTYGGYLAVWTDSTDADYDVYAQRVTTSGILTGTKLTVIADSIDQMDANVTYNVNTNEYLIVWTEDQGLLSGWDIYGRRLRGDGVFTSIPFLITGAGGDQLYPTAAAETNLGWYTVVWVDNRNSHSEIYGRRVTGTGVLYGNDAVIETNEVLPPDFPYWPMPQITYHPQSNELYVVWLSSTGMEVAGRRISASGALSVLGNLRYLWASPTPSETLWPQIVANPLHAEYMAIFQYSYERREIYGQRLDTQGVELDNPNTNRNESIEGIHFPIALGTGFIHNTIVGNDTGLFINTTDSDLLIAKDNNLLNNTIYNADNGGLGTLNLRNNYWSITDTAQISSTINGSAIISPVLTVPDSTAPAILWRLFFSREGDPTLVRAEEGIDYGPVGSEILNLTFDFSKSMDTSLVPIVTIGNGTTSVYTPTHLVQFGQWVSPTQWVGQYQVNWYTGDGSKRISIGKALGIIDGLSIPTDRRFTFEVSILGASSTDVEGSWGRVTLSWQAADFDTVAGYHIYRSTTSGGPYTRINNGLVTTNVYTDTDVVNQTDYYYQITVVTTDFQETNYGDEVVATPNDVTGASIPIVTDDGTCTPYTNQLHATWSASDPESGISEYLYALGNTPAGTQVVSWSSTGTIPEVTHTGLNLQVGQTYYLSVKARNGAGIWSAIGSSDGIEINSGCPAVAFTASPRSGSYPLLVQFDDQSIGSALAHLWDFGDGNTSSAADPSHVYSSVGVFTVTLTVTGTIASSTRMEPAYIVVNEPPPIAAFIATPTSGQSPLTVSFTDQSIGMIDSWLWSFGDGITSTLQSPSHVYITEGTYTATLTVSGPGGDNNEIKVGFINVSNQHYIYLPTILK